MTDTNESNTHRGIVFYDGHCAVCTRLASVFERPLGRRGFALATLQSRAAKNLGLDERALMQQMWLLTRSGERIGGADAIIRLAGHVWWGWPLALSGRSSFLRNIMRGGYRRFAARRACVGNQCQIRN